ncbi:MAG: hypothetical protein HYZ53_15855 [Planctomycetes bacterium]|nr:hypothetical protein [Planctomycetota bacterium]
MIRATMRNGQIQPLDPLPAEWEEGRELIIEEAEQTPSTAEIDAWVRDVQEATSKIRPEDHAALEANIKEIRAEAKEQARKEMGLSQ